jgi:hypothetical protein
MAFGVLTTVQGEVHTASRPHFWLGLYLGGARRGCACEDVPLVALLLFSS